MFLSVITKNLNWEVLSKNLVIFRRWDGVKKKLILWGSTENSDFHEKPIYKGEARLFTIQKHSVCSIYDLTSFT